MSRGRGRPGGNPLLKEYWAQTDRDEPLKFKLQVRIPQSMKDALEELEDKNEFVRIAIARALQELE